MSLTDCHISTPHHHHVISVAANIADVTKDSVDVITRTRVAVRVAVPRVLKHADASVLNPTTAVNIDGAIEMANDDFTDVSAINSVSCDYQKVPHRNHTPGVYLMLTGVISKHAPILPDSLSHKDPL